jgi:hypothetical protein
MAASVRIPKLSARPHPDLGLAIAIQGLGIDSILSLKRFTDGGLPFTAHFGLIISVQIREYTK